MNNLKIFENPIFGKVRVVEVNGEPWFVAKDVAEALNYQWKGTATINHVPEEWRGVYSVQTPSGMQEMLIISEQGLYFFLGRSDKPKALPFQKWAAGDVFPALRKNGYYGQLTAKELIANPDILIELGNSLKQSQEQYLALTERYEVLEAKKTALENAFWQDRPKVVFANSFNISTLTIDMAQMAIMIIQNTGHNIGLHKLFKWCRNVGLICKNKRKNCEPTQLAINKGLMKVRTATYDYGYRIRKYRQAMVTPAGQEYILNEFLNGRGLC